MFILTEQEILDAIKNCHDAYFRMAEKESLGRLNEPKY